MSAKRKPAIRGGRSSAPAGSSSSSDDEPAQPHAKKRDKVKGIAQVAADEVASLNHDDTVKKKPPPQKQGKPAPDKHAPETTPAVDAAATERQRTIAERRAVLDAANKVQEDAKESERLAEENKKLKLLLQKEKEKTAQSPSTPSASRRPATPRASNSARREITVCCSTTVLNSRA